MSVSHSLHRTRKTRTARPAERDRPVAPVSPGSILVLSLSQPIHDLLRSGTGRYYHAGRFQRAANLWLGREENPGLISLVAPEIGNGPFHLVVNALPPAWVGDGQVSWQGTTLRIGSWVLEVPPDTQVWDPRPRWSDLTLSPARFRALQSRTDAETREAVDSARLLPGMALTLTTRLAALVEAVAREDETAMATSAAAMAGLGLGLTPAGDDMLAGVMLAFWAARPSHAPRLAHILYTAAAPRTMRLARAFLAAAARGEAMETWHDLLAALSGAGDLDTATARVLAHGATSGLDMLRGFVNAYARLACV